MSLEYKQFNLNIFDHSPIAYCVVELIKDDKGKPSDWIYRYCNQAFADIKEYRLEAMINHSFLGLTPYMDPKWLQAYSDAAYDNKICEMKLTVGKNNYQAKIIPIGEEGLCSCIIYPAAEMTDPESGKKEPVESEQYILNRLSTEYVSIYRIDLNTGRYTILRLLNGTNAKKIVGDDYRVYDTFDEYSRYYADNFILDEDRDEFLSWLACDNMKKQLLEHDRITYHYQSVSKEGKHNYYEAYAVKGQVDDKQFNVFLAFRNIDNILYKEKEIQGRLKKALDEARLSNEIISAIAKTYQYISRIDIRADYFEEISNRDEENLHFIKSGTLSSNNEKVCREVVAEEYQEAFFKFVDLKTLPDRMKDEETIVLEYRMKDGNWHRLRFIEKKRDPDGRLTHVLCVIRSISASKKKEQDLLYQVEEAKKNAALKTRFLSNMSHDIRTPLNGIIGMIEMAGRYPDDLEIQRKCREKSMISLKYLVSLVNDILDMNKLESPDYIMKSISFDLTEVLNKVNTSKQIQATEKDIEYIIDWDKAEIRHQYLYGNPVFINKLLTAVCDNAIKFTNPGGSIRVWCNELSADDDRIVYEFGCSDTGIGMSKDFIEHAFDMFSQENESSRTKYEGSGLGLAIARKIIERLDGTIRISSEKGHGTTALMTIPFKPGEPNESIKKTDKAAVSVKGLRALVVEDNELNMEIAKFLLEDEGIIVECAMDGQEAVDKFANAAPGYYDVIFMDIMMPNLNGWDTTRRIRSMQKEDSQSIPIIAMSANGFTEDIINSRIAGMNQHLIKPLTQEKLLAALRECI